MRRIKQFGLFIVLIFMVCICQGCPSKRTPAPPPEISNDYGAPGPAEEAEDASSKAREELRKLREAYQKKDKTEEEFGPNSREAQDADRNIGYRRQGLEKAQEELRKTQEALERYQKGIESDMEKSRSEKCKQEFLP
jgi:hypothetical protein